MPVNNSSPEGRGGILPVRVVVEVEMDKDLKNTTTCTAILKGSLSRCYPPLTTDVVLRFIPSPLERVGEDDEITTPHIIRQIARAGAFEVVIKINLLQKLCCAGLCDRGSF